MRYRAGGPQDRGLRLNHVHKTAVFASVWLMLRRLTQTAPVQIPGPQCLSKILFCGNFSLRLIPFLCKFCICEFEREPECMDCISFLVVLGRMLLHVLINYWSTLLINPMTPLAVSRKKWTQISLSIKYSKKVFKSI